MSHLIAHHQARRHERSRSPFRPASLIIALGLLAGGCTSGASRLDPAGRTASVTSICTTVRCIYQVAMEPHYDACMGGLFNQTPLRSQQEAIFQEFRYPFSNASGYFNWVRMGGSGPAPQEWCRHYAYRKLSRPTGAASA